MTLHGTSVLITDKPVRGRVVNGSIPVLSFVPILDGVFDIQPAGTPVSQAAWLRQLAEAASELAIQVERNAAVTVLMTAPHDGHEASATCPACPHPEGVTA